MITYELAILTGVFLTLLFIILGLIIKIPKCKMLIGCSLIIYLSLVAAITLFPITYEIKTEYFGDTTWYNFIPFKSIIGMFEYGVNITVITQILGNILITVPFGVLITLLINKKHLIKLLLLALSFSIAIELSQLIIGLAIDNMYRTVDIDDVILNFTGVCMGYFIYKLIPVKIKSKLI